MAIINKRKTLLWNCPAQERTVVRWYLLLASYVAVCSSGAREHILGALLYCIGHGDTQVSGPVSGNANVTSLYQSVAPVACLDRKLIFWDI